MFEDVSNLNLYSYSSINKYWIYMVSLMLTIWSAVNNILIVFSLTGKLPVTPFYRRGKKPVGILRGFCQLIIFEI